MTTDIAKLARIVDQLGTTKGAISYLEELADKDKASIIEAAAKTGERAFEGNLFRTTVSFSNKTVTDWREVLDALVPMYNMDRAVIERVISANTKTAEGVPCVRVFSRKAS